MIGAIPTMASWRANGTPYLYLLFLDNGTVESKRTRDIMHYFGGPIVGVAD